MEYREEPCRSALNRVKGMPFDWSLNPYTGCAHRCTFCYVRAFEARADRPSDDRYGRSIRVKVNVADVLRRELARPSWKRESVAIGAATDPYQPAEGRFRLTRACIRELGRARTPFSLITRGPLIRRDVDVLVEAASRAKVHVSFSVPTLDERIWRTTEPGTAPPRRRLETVRLLVDAGIHAGVALAPILPGLSDGPELLAEVVREARAAGATGIWANVLYLRPGTREHFLEALARDWPELLPRYERLYEGRAYLSASEVEPVRAAVRGLARERSRPRRPPIRPAPEAEQLALAVGRCGKASRPARRISLRDRKRRDHRDDRRRPRGRPGGPPARAPALPAHSRGGRGARRRDRRLPRGAAPARRRDHGPADAADGRHRGNRGDRRARPRQPRSRLHGVQREGAAAARARVGRPRLRPQGGAARHAPQGDRAGRGGRDVRRPGADPVARDRPGRTGDPHPARA